MVVLNYGLLDVGNIDDMSSLGRAPLFIEQVGFCTNIDAET